MGKGFNRRDFLRAGAADAPRGGSGRGDAEGRQAGRHLLGQRQFYVLSRSGEHAGVLMYPSHYALCTEKGPATLATEALHEGRP